MTEQMTMKDRSGRVQSQLPDYGHSSQIRLCMERKNGLIASTGADGKLVVYKEKGQEEQVNGIY